MTIGLRRAEPADYHAFLGLFAELGIPEPPPTADVFATHLLPHLVVAHAGDDVIGYITWRTYGTTVHVRNIAVDRAWRGRRVGERLLERVRELAKAAGCTRWYLNVKVDNAPAIRLYERCGFAHDKESWVLSIPWSAALALPFVPSLEVAAVRPNDDAVVAARLRLDPARIATLRADERALLLAVHAPDGGPVAFAAFTPAFPGAYPFVTRRPDLAGNLFRACHAHAHLERFDFVQLSVEGDRPLYEMLIAAGAELTFALYQLASAL